MIVRSLTVRIADSPGVQELYCARRAWPGSPLLVRVGGIAVLSSAP